MTGQLGSNDASAPLAPSPAPPGSAWGLSRRSARSYSGSSSAGSEPRRVGGLTPIGGGKARPGAPTGSPPASPYLAPASARPGPAGRGSAVLRCYGSG